MMELEWTSDIRRVPHGELLQLMEEARLGDDGPGDRKKCGISQIETMFGPGIVGFFALNGSDLVAFARVLSDDYVCSSLAEMGVHPQWRGKGIGRSILSRLRDRFGHTAIYVQSPASKLEFFLKNGLIRKSKLVACGAEPGQGNVGTDIVANPGLRITRDISQLSPDALSDLYDSVGFGIRDATPAEVLSGCFGSGVEGDFAYAGDRLVGMARVMTDGVASSWLSEICVRPECQGRGVGRALMASVQARYAQTGIYAEAFSNQVEFFARQGLPTRPNWIACSLGPIRSRALP
jgi:GNAT superfamily N-acetyltransferase